MRGVIEMSEIASKIDHINKLCIVCHRKCGYGEQQDKWFEFIDEPFGLVGCHPVICSRCCSDEHDPDEWILTIFGFLEI